MSAISDRIRERLERKKAQSDLVLVQGRLPRPLFDDARMALDRHGFSWNDLIRGAAEQLVDETPIETRPETPPVEDPPPRADPAPEPNDDHQEA